MKEWEWERINETARKIYFIETKTHVERNAVGPGRPAMHDNHT